MPKLKEELSLQYKKLKQKQLQLDSIDVYKDIDNVFCVYEQNENIEQDFYLAKYEGSLLLSEIGVLSCANQTNIFPVLGLAVVMKFAIPIIARKLSKGVLFGFEWDGWFYTGIELSTLLLFLLQNYFFVMVGVVDF